MAVNKTVQGAILRAALRGVSEDQIQASLDDVIDIVKAGAPSAAAALVTGDDPTGDPYVCRILDLVLMGLMVERGWL